MTWTVLLHDDFDAELLALEEDLQDELLAHAKLLVQFGPNLGRPTVDTLKGSAHANMKELRAVGFQTALRPTNDSSPTCNALPRRGNDHGKHASQKEEATSLCR